MFETTMAESFLGVALVNDISSETLTYVLRHLYTGHVEQEWLSCPEIASELVYASEKYWLSCLRSYCDKHLIRAATRTNCLKLIELANLHNLETAAMELLAFQQDKIIWSKPISTTSKELEEPHYKNSGYDLLR